MSTIDRTAATPTAPGTGARIGLRDAAGLIGQLLRHRRLILAMAVREYRTRFVGTAGGWLWSIINPLMMVLVYWFVFSVGMRVQPVGDVPFVAVFVCGLLPWLLFSDAVAAGAESVTGSAHLVTKTVFPTEILPAVSFVVGCFTHVVLLAIAAVLLAACGIRPSLYWLQCVYFFAALAVFCTGLNWICSALNVFFRDMRQLLGVCLNLWFWMTPIVWGMEMLPAGAAPWLKLNPMYYVVEGYKASLIFGRPFWYQPRVTLVFWCVALATLLLGAVLFRRLKPEFAEVL